MNRKKVLKYYLYNIIYFDNNNDINNLFSKL